MSFNFFKKAQKNNIGLDINPEGVTITSLSKKDNGYVLDKYVQESFDQKFIKDGLIVNPDILAEKLKEIISQNNLDIKEADIAFSSNLMFIKTINLPNLPIEELRSIAPQEAAKHVPLSINEMNVDLHVLEENTEENKVDVVLCALSKSIARNHVEFFENMGINITSIDVASFATIRAIENSGLIENPESVYISVLIGYDSTDINIIKNGMPVFSHNIQMGKKNVIEAISNSFEIKEKESRKMLSDIVLIIPGMEMSSNTDLNKAANITRNIYSNIISEIEKAIEFYNSQNSESENIEKIIVGGCGVCLHNIDKYFSNKLKIETQLSNPLANISHNIDLSNDCIVPINIPALSTSIGLALKGFEN